MSYTFKIWIQNEVGKTKFPACTKVAPSGLRWHQCTAAWLLRVTKFSISTKGQAEISSNTFVWSRQNMLKWNKMHSSYRTGESKDLQDKWHGNVGGLWKSYGHALWYRNQEMCPDVIWLILLLNSYHIFVRWWFRGRFFKGMKDSEMLNSQRNPG